MPKPQIKTFHKWCRENHIPDRVEIMLTKYLNTKYHGTTSIDLLPEHVYASGFRYFLQILIEEVKNIML